MIYASMGVVNIGFVDSSTGWKLKQETRNKPQSEPTHSESSLFSLDSPIQEDELFEEARREFIINWSKK